VLPDTSRWTYAYSGSALIPLYESPDESFGAGCPRQRPTAQQLQLVVGHPAGASATFAFDYLQHERTGVAETSCTGPHGELGFIRTIANVFDGFSIVSKVVAGPGIQPMAWAYAYPRACDTRNCQKNNRVVRVTQPDQSRVDHVFGTAWNLNEGRLLATQTFGSDGALLSTTNNSYVSDAEVLLPPASTPSLPFPREVGANWGSDDPGSVKIRPLRTTSITQQGVLYSTTHQAFDAHARPLRTLKSGAAGDSKTELVQYRDFIDASPDLRWVVGQVEWQADDASCPGLVDGPACRKVKQVGYSPVSGLPIAEYQFGLLMNTRSYLGTGQLHELFDPSLQKVTVLSDYHRGIPRAVSYRDDGVTLAGESALVSDHGEITRITGAAGYSTDYAYDPMGRLREITYPTNDLTNWNRTTIQFGPSGSPAFGLPAGHWLHRRFTGAGYTDTYLDGLWRPVMTRTYDQNDEGSTRKVVVRQFDHNNREVYASYPKRDVPFVGSQPEGTWTLHDALGRVQRIDASSELGLLSTSYAYPAAAAGQRAGIEITDPDSYKQLTQHLAYGQPGTDWPTRISRQVELGGGLESITTINRDPWGKPLAIVRSGTFDGQQQSLTRRFVYDAFERLCMRFDPESNWHVQGYDASNNIAWTAGGQALGNPATCQPGNPAQRSLRLYDGRNRLQTLDHPEPAADLHYAYYPDGALQTLSVGRWNGTALVEASSTWSYAYDRRRLLRSETLAAGGLSFAIGHGYDGNGFRRQLVYPGNQAIELAPNALGEPTRAGTYATGLAYHPSGAVSRFTYGNGFDHTTQLNTRLLPNDLTESRVDTSLLALGFQYDRRGNLLQINDRQIAGDDPDESRFMAYDGLGRMTRADGVAATTNSPQVLGQEHYTYDALDNLRLLRYPGVLELQFDYHASSNRLASLNQFFIGPNQGRNHIYGYDYQGNITSGIGPGPGFHIRSHAFDAANRMTSATAQGATEGYRYDGHGRRVSIQRGAETSHQVYDRSGRLLYERAHGDAVTRHIYVGSRLVASDSSSTGVRYQHTDLLGSPVRTTNDVGARATLTVFAPYGSLQRQIPADSNPQGPGYTGHVTDRASGLVYMQQRYYDPIAMRFVSVDPVHVDASSGANFNRYWYANNSPYTYVDPDGRESGCVGTRIPSVCKNGGVPGTQTTTRPEDRGPRVLTYSGGVDLTGRLLAGGTLWNSVKRSQHPTRVSVEDAAKLASITNGGTLAAGGALALGSAGPLVLSVGSELGIGAHVLAVEFVASPIGQRAIFSGCVVLGVCMMNQPGVQGGLGQFARHREAIGALRNEGSVRNFFKWLIRPAE
jgi:RHS repeat-associated protein